MRNAALPPKRHYSIETRYSLERIECCCGEIVKAEPDKVPDRHGPLIEAWQRHIVKRPR